jgi:NAD(P)-dependent dehydrogenase (short-subunit alcohol dehydrogenase family)
MTAFNLNGRVVLLTGAAGYLGREMSRAILAAGADLMMVGRRERALLEHRNGLAPEFRERCHVIVCDITESGAPQYLRSEAEQRFGRLHGIVNNAYSGKVGTIEAVVADDFLAACTYNLVAPFGLVKAFLPLLERTAADSQGTVSVVNITSMYGTVSPDPSVYADSGQNNPVHYGASKGGMIQMTRYLACHLGARGIRVNSLAPGAFPDTSVDPGIPRFFDSLANRVPMKRVGKPVELGGPLVFLLSEAASYVNGINLAVDGGWTAW